MNTSKLSQTAPLAAVPTHLPLLAWVSGALHRVKTLLIHTLEKQEPSEQPYHRISLPATPLLFSGKSIYTPLRDWDSYR